MRFRSKPESNIISDNLAACSSPTADPACAGSYGVSSGRLVDTGNICGNVKDFNLAGAELAAVYGPFSLQGEYIHANVNRELAENLDFDGYYVYGSWFLTGESRNYRPDKGVFDVLVPKQAFSLNHGGLGAWELGVRFSSLDLTDENINGGEERNLTVGLNWYPNQFLRFMANYVNVLDLEGGPHDGEEIDLFQVRAQVVY